MKTEKRPNNHVHVPSTLSFHSISSSIHFIPFLFSLSFHFSHLVDLHRPYLHPHED